jgi:DNA primase
MATWVNFAEIRDKVSLEDVLFRYYRIETLTRDGTKAIGPCPVHGGDSPRAFHAALERNIWHCFSRCRGGGNQLDFVARKEGISIREAALRLQAHFLGPDPPPPPAAPPARAAPAPAAERPPEPKAPVEPAVNPPLDLHLELLHDHPHLMSERRLALATCEAFDVGYCRRGMLRGMIAVPIHDADGHLVAYAGRRLKPDEIRTHGKYKLPKGFRKELVLFNYHRAKGLAAEQGLVLVEGFFSVFKLHETGIHNAVAAMGCEVSEHQLELLATAKDVVVLFDGDEAGRAGALAVLDALASRIPVRIAHLPDGLQPDALSPRALRWLVNGLQLLDLAEVRISFRTDSTAKAGA